MKRNLTSLCAFLSGTLFAVGLGISGMLEPKKIVGFLDVLGKWDPTLIFVMLGAVAVHMTLYRLILKRSSPLFDSKFHIPTNQKVDTKLILGSALFGAGWGISGLCPGPSVVSSVTGSFYVLVFVSTMIIGMIIGKMVEKRI